MFAFGMGGNRRLRSIRLGAVVLIVLAGVVLHHSGPVYDALRFAYLALVIGFVVVAARSRQSRGFGGATRARANRWDALQNPGYGPPPTSPVAPSTTTTLVDSDDPTTKGPASS